MDLELISFAICPFGQRALITLNHKGTAHRITHIDFDHPPSWLKEISPFGKVPLLRVDHRHILFESAVIDEFLNEITPDSLLPTDPLLRALNRGWIEFGSACLVNLSGMMHAQDQAGFERHEAALQHQLRWLEQTLENKPYFNGTDVSLVDFTYAPLFMRIDLLGLEDTLYAGKLPRISDWAEELLTLEAVKKSVVENFTALLKAHIRTTSPYAAPRLGL